MEIKSNKAELLAPAGSFDSLKAAINAGADGVYLGGESFGARAYAANFSNEEILEAIDYVHLHGAKIYVTVNTLLKDEELEEKLYDYVKPMYQQGVDAILVQDLGVLSALSEWFKELPIHISTQVSIAGSEGFSFFSKYPSVKRIVTARELTLDEIREIKKQTSLEIECFIHGAMCYSYSGQCLLSSLIGGRSGNRGRCAQPCRMPYQAWIGTNAIGKEKKTYLSMKDMSTLGILPELLDAGIDSLKIEGRMKKPEYTAGVVRLYRKYMDMYYDILQVKQERHETYRIDEKDKRELEDLFQRRGYEQGYYHVRKEHHKGAGADMICLNDAPEKKEEINLRAALIKKLNRDYVQAEKKEKIKGILEISAENPAKLTVSYKEEEVIETGEIVSKALQHPMSDEDLKKQIQKTGQTPYEFEELKVVKGDDVFISNGALNELRRNALEKLSKNLLSKTRREIIDKKPYGIITDSSRPREEFVFSASVKNVHQLESVLKFPELKTICLDSEIADMKELEACAAMVKNANRECIYRMPMIFRHSTMKRYEKDKEYFLGLSIDGFEVGNYESAAWLMENEILTARKLITGPGLYTFNKRAMHAWEDMGVHEFVAPYELNYHELKKRGMEKSHMVVYGHIPLMVTANCIYKTTQHCLNHKILDYGVNEIILSDRMNMKFPVKPVCSDCYNIIYNGQPLSLLCEQEKLHDLSPLSLRMDFTGEDGKQVEKMSRLFIHNLMGEGDCENLKTFTRGHFKRGVE